MFSLKGSIRRLIALFLLILQSPAFACAMNPYLIWMIPPFGVYVLLVSPWNPFFLFKEARWLVVRNITIPHLAYVGLVFVMLGVGVFIASCVQLFGHWKKGLVTYGLYSVVRHPQYVGLIIGTLGFSLMNLRPASLIMWITLAFGYVLLADSEERDLERKYGEAFRLYKQKVPFMLPILPPNSIEQTIKLPESRLKRYAITTTIYLLTVTITTIILYAFLPNPSHR